MTQAGIKIIGLTSYNLSPIFIYKAFEMFDYLSQRMQQKFKVILI